MTHDPPKSQKPQKRTLHRDSTVPPHLHLASEKGKENKLLTSRGPDSSITPPKTQTAKYPDQSHPSELRDHTTVSGKTLSAANLFSTHGTHATDLSRKRWKSVVRPAASPWMCVD
jgi:hypothetical protein